MGSIPVPPHHGPFEGVPMGDPVMEDIQVINDPFDDADNYGGGKKKNKKDRESNDQDTIKTGRPHYEGCALERLKPMAGENLSWRRCGRRWLPYSQEQLVALVKQHWKLTGRRSPNTDFERLSGNQQGIINRVIDEKRLNEKSKTAEWNLVDIQALQRRTGVMSKEAHKLQIVIKRTDKGNDKNGYAATGTQSYPIDDVIDLAIPLAKKKETKKPKADKRRSRSLDGIDPLDDPLNMGFGPNDLPPQDNRDQHFHDHQPHYDHHPQPQHQAPPQVPLPPDWQPQPNPFDPHAQFPVDPRASFPGGARHFNDANPFYPQEHVAAPGQYDEPREFVHPHQGARARTRSADRDRVPSRSRSRRRQSVARRPSRDRRRDSQRRRDDSVEDMGRQFDKRRASRRRDDSVEDIGRKFDRMYRNDRDSNSSNFDEESLWSRSDGRYSRSPDTSIFSDDYPPRDRSKRNHRDSDPPRPRYRSNRYRDVEYQPEYTHRNRDRRYSPHGRRQSRPKLPHAITYDGHHDDYPSGRGAEPRYLPPAPPQRRLTDFGNDKRGDFFDRDFQQPWRQPGAVDREQDAFEAGLRAAQRQGRRDSYYP